MFKKMLNRNNDETLDYSGSTPNNSLGNKSHKMMSKDEQIEALMKVIENQKEMLTNNFIEKNDHVAMIKNLHMRLHEYKTKNEDNTHEIEDNEASNIKRWETLEDLSHDETIIHESTPLKRNKRYNFREIIRDDAYQQGLASLPIKNKHKLGHQRDDSSDSDTQRNGKEAYQKRLAPLPIDFTKKNNIVNYNLQNQDSIDSMNNNFSNTLKFTLQKSLYKFHGKPNEDLDDWIFSMERFFKKCRITEEEKVEIAVDYLRENARTTYRSIPNYEFIYWEDLKRVLLDNYQPKNLQKALRKKISNLRQHGTIQTYIHDFDKLMNQITDMSEADKIDRFTEGLKLETGQKVAYEEPSTLIEAKSLALRIDTYFNTNNERSNFYNNNRYNLQNRNQNRLNEYRRYSTKNNEEKEKEKEKASAIKQKSCFKCNERWFYGHKCGNTENNKKNSTSVVETRNKFQQEDRKQTTTTNQNAYNFITMNTNPSLMIVKGLVDGHELNCILDTGATTSVISENISKRLCIAIDEKETKVKLANGGTVTGKFTKKVPVIINGRYSEISFVIMPNNDIEVLLGLDWLKQHNVTIDPSEGILKFPKESVVIEQVNETDASEKTYIADVDEEELQDNTSWDEPKPTIDLNATDLNEIQKKEFKDYISTFDIFAYQFGDLGCCNVYEHIIQTDASKPIFMYPYRKSMTERKAIKEEVQKMLEADIIRPSKSPWSFPVVMIPKKDGSKRFCVDYRKLNAITQQDCFPMPRIDDILDRLGKSRYFTAIDLKSGYWQIKLSDDSIPKTAFSTPDGHYEFLRLPFGLKNAPADFSRLMTQILGDLPNVEIYLDDITIHSKTYELHLIHLKEVFNRLKNVNLKINPTKCTWFQKEVKILGHVISENKIQMDPAKIETVKQMQFCKNVKQIQSFLGLTGYYRKFIKDYAKICQPLNNLIKKDTKWDFTDTCKEAFNTLKNKLTEFPILRQPDHNKPFVLMTDASGFALGAILAQKDEDKEYVCCYASRLLKGAENHYGITEKECLAVVWAIKHFRIYLYGNKFQVITDHAALNWLMTINDPTGRLARWSIYLQAYNFEIIHRRGRIHSNVDALSRPVLLIENTNETSTEDSEESYLDVFDDEYLLYYLQYGRHKDGCSRKQVKRVTRLKDHYKMIDNKLYYRKQNNGEFNLMVPTKQERKDIVINAHILGHFQFQTTYDRLKQKYFWKNMINEIKETINQCLTCIRHQKQAEIHQKASALEINGIFERIGIDLILGLPETDEGYKGIMVITEYLTKYPYAVPIKSKSAEEIAEQLWHYISIFGPPKEILSDQGTEFLNEIVKNLTKSIGVEHRITSPYHPQTNGLTERFNQTLIQSLKKHTENDPKQWNKWLPFVLLAYRTRIHSSSGFTPFQLMFGREMNMFEDYKTLTDTPIEKRSKEIKELLEETHPKTIEKLKSKQEQQKEQQNVRNKLEDEKLKIGQTVTIKSLKIQSKLQPNYHGIYKIDEITAKGNYYLINEKNERLKQSYPRSRLKVIEVNKDLENEKHFEVEAIRDVRKRRNKYEYLVKWKDYPENDCTWEPEEHFDTTEIIEEFWANKHSINMTYTPMNWLWKSIFMFMIIFSCINNSTAFKVKDKFKYCEVHGTKAIWDMPESCAKPIQIDAGKKEIFHIISKKSNEIEGKGWKCFKKYIRVETYKTFWGTETDNSLNPIEVIDSLTREDCIEMVHTRKCEKIRMNCDNNYCVTDEKPNLKYNWLQTNKYEYVYCEIYEMNIISENKDTKIFTQQHIKSSCLAKDLYCQLKNSIIVWELNIIHECSYTYVKTLELEKISHMLVSKKENKLFQVIDNQTLCGSMKAWKTVEGFYLTKDDEATKLSKSTNDIKTIDNLILTEMDYQTANVLNLITNLFLSTNEKICQLYKTFTYLFTKMDDEFFLFNDFNGNEGILYSDDGRIFIPECMIIEEIEIIEKTEQCYKDIPVQLEYKNNTLNLFLTQERIIKSTSKIAPCTNNNQNIYLPLSQRVLLKKDNIVTFVEDNQFIHLKFNLQNTNITTINFNHDDKIVNSINVVKKMADISEIEEENGVFHIMNDFNQDIKNKILDILTHLGSNSFSIFSILAHNALLYLCVVILIIKGCTILHNTYKKIKDKRKEVLIHRHNKILKLLEGHNHPLI